MSELQKDFMVVGALSGAARIAAERQRQITVEGWTPDHDDQHDDGSLALAAVCYAAPEPVFTLQQFDAAMTFSDPWPWQADGDKRPRDEHDCLRSPSLEERIRMLEKAGALIAAEIDRLLRIPTPGQT
jgi:hypothetical protein